MVTIVIFLAVALAMLFFLLGITFRGLASAVNALLTSSAIILGLGGLAVLMIIALYLLYMIAHGIATHGIVDVILTIILLFILVGGVVAIVCGIGSSILMIILNVTIVVLSVIVVVFEGAAILCERGYVKSLGITVKYTNKC